MNCTLPRRHRESFADSTACSPAIVVVPDGLASDNSAGRFEAGATTGQHVRARSRKIGIHPRARGFGVVGPMITRGAADGDAQDGSFLTDSVVVVQGLLSGGGLGGAPTDGNHRRLAHGVMDSGTQSIEESIVRVRGEVNSDLCLWSDSTDDFNIQHDLTVGAVRRACGCVVAAVHG